MATTILFLRNEEGQTEARQPKVWPSPRPEALSSRSWRQQAYHFRSIDFQPAAYPLLRGHNTTETIFLSAIRCPLNATIDWEMTTPTSSSILGDGGRRIRAWLSRGEPALI
jgi:hypothetical protein